MGRKKVVVVGAGPSGLVALKEMLEAGHDAVCIERSHVIGGVFSTLAESAYDSLYLTISNVFMAYSDFPCKEEYIKYSTKEEYARYLEAYAANFGLCEKIRFETEVATAKLDDDDAADAAAGGAKWTIDVRSVKDPRKTTRMADVDSLVVCTGSNQVPKKTPANIAKFGGEILHSSEFRNAADFKGKRALIVGVGESAADIASEISEVAARTTVWSRRPVLVAPRYLQMAMTEPNFDEFECLGDESTWRRCAVGDFLEMATTSRANNVIPPWIYGLIRHAMWKALSKQTAKPAMRMFAKHCEFATNYPGVDAGTYLRADQAGWVTKNCRLMQMLGTGAVELIVARDAVFGGDDDDEKKNSKSCTFPDVRIHNDTDFHAAAAAQKKKTKKTKQKEEPPPVVSLTRDFDVVVCCTGYTNDFDWLDAGSKKPLDWCPRTWYKHCWPPGFGDSLAFVGWARPHQGGIPQTAELCARYHALLLAGERSLPTDIADLTKQEADAEETQYVLSPSLTSLVDWPSYAHSLVRMIGCEPKTPWFVLSPATWLKYWLYPLWPCWFRLRGPGAKPDTFTTVMDRFPVIGQKVIIEPLYLLIVIPWSVAQKLILNVLFFPFTLAKGPNTLLTFFTQSKINMLHGNRLRLRDLFNWST